MIVWEDLQEAGLGIYVEKPGFSYGSDAVALAAFVRAGPKDRFLDLGCGTGILSILLHARTGAHFTAVDIQPALCALARRSVTQNGQQAGVAVLEADIRSLPKTLGYESFDGAVCNPPYFVDGTRSTDVSRRLSRHQESCSMTDLARCASRMLKNGGHLYLCYPAALFALCCTALVENGLEPKRIKPVPADFSGILLIEAKKGGKPGIQYEC